LHKRFLNNECQTLTRVRWLKGKIKILVLVIILVTSTLVIDVSSRPNRQANGSPKPGTDFNGPHYNLNLIGKSKEMPGDYLDSDRHAMFVPINTSGMYFTNPDDPLTPVWEGIKIEMTQGDDFFMLDGDATDGYGALQLGPGRYHVYIAVKAKSPKYEDPKTDITGWVQAYDNVSQLWYYIDVGIVTVSKGKNKWTDATDLFFVNTDEDTFGFLLGDETDYIADDDLGMWVFDYMSGLDSWAPVDEYGNLIYDLSELAYFWQFVNTGNKLIQVRFYPM
jgi:hypothetical protein